MDLLLYPLLPALILGYAVLQLLLRILPSRIHASTKSQSQELVKEAKVQQQAILQDKKNQAEEEIELLNEELETELLELNERIQTGEAALQERELLVQEYDETVAKKEAISEHASSQVDQLRVQYESLLKTHEDSKAQLISGLESASKLDAKTAVKSIKTTLTDQRQLEAQKILKTLNEEIGSNSKKLANRVLERTLARYSPDFAWPKNTNLVEIEDQDRLLKFAESGSDLFEELKQISEIDIQVVGLDDNRHYPMIKVAGGFGINREAARLTLMEISKKDQASWKNPMSIWKIHLDKLEREAMDLGKRAVNDLRLQGIHPEVQRLIGALNWRTSYRQNQWYHTVEVAVLAGILAAELGVDPDAAKRVGLLHDIGKAIDYRIDGSHAVISGDYADRYGESRLICDTVMSHHADLIVESPLAFVLRAADTLSGARPGARVNLEEGYQIRLSAIAEAVKSFPGVNDLAIMNGGREVHVGVSHHRVSDAQIKELTEAIARKIETDVAFPGQIKVLVTRSYEAVTVA